MHDDGHPSIKALITLGLGLMVVIVAIIAGAAILAA